MGSCLSQLPKPPIPSQLTSVVFSAIHLVIHVHGKFLKKPVTELEAQRGAKALSGPLAPSATRASSPGVVRCGKPLGPLCHPAPQSQTWKLSAKLQGGRAQKEGQTRPAHATVCKGRARVKGKGWRSRKEEPGEAGVRAGQRLGKGHQVRGRGASRGVGVGGG